MRYIASSLHRMSLRISHDTGADKIGLSRDVRELFQGDEVWTATEDKFDESGIQINKVGDKWLRVLRAGDEMVDLWVAIVHNGRVYCDVFTDSGEPTTEPPGDGVKHIIEVMVTYETNDGRVLLQRTVPDGEPSVV